ncbi:2-oxoacid:acceptor oxidoreductase subunit alpha [Natranaerofaba carboxydovora]|uniref:2-oxoacid:acceptor oxidoreductase subunit alpha n=1 Tax=Natranaerofaba carboxydovora TaxID=2742683 RepID=UPI001F1299C3|nr:2-oxoacid:acceptor oxidoreductase subunit alpha [Natranaerofaba carboxydovora]UMZ74798.1 2-oxoglutarate oxidoreductase subunit KorA [Natranaerofaba carboxydovora]
MGEVKFLQGNEACAEGAIAAGGRFFGGYPITPSSEIAAVAAAKLPKVDGCYLQLEDEIASIAAVIGASMSGAKSFTATSGPGFSLMQENLGVAVIGEVPCVIINVSRGGPSTGLATKQAQGDVMQTRWGTHGDHSIIVLAPSSVQECFDLTVEAFNLSEKYRTPVIVLTDKTVGHLREDVEIKKPEELEIVDRKKPTCSPEEYKPYKPDTDMIPPISNYGDPHLQRVNSSMHGEEGFLDMSPENSQKVVQRLWDKIEKNIDDIGMIETYHMDDAETAIISFGISARSSLQAVDKARKEGQKIGLVQLKTLWPFPEDKIKEAVKDCSDLVVVELNMGQLALEVERVFRDKDVLRINKFSGEDILPGEILEKLKEVPS